jgi:hypothetical protein
MNPIFEAWQKKLYARTVFDKMTKVDMEKIFTENILNMRTVFELIEHMDYHPKGKELKQVMEKTRPNWTREFKEIYMVYVMGGKLL